jgi:glutaredoxin
MADVEVYGTDRCEYTRHALEHMRWLGVGFSYVNIDEDPKAAEWVREQTGGQQKVPVIKVGDRILSVPDDGELDRALRGIGAVS